MENSSSQGIDSDENFDEQKSVDHEISDNIDLSLGKIDKIVEESGEGLPLLGNAVEPYVGMEFKSRDAAREVYIAYGRHIGFTVRIHHNRRSRINNSVIGQDFVCSKEGFREKKYMYRKDRVLPPPPITREGCPAMLRLASRDGGQWVVTKFVKEHTMLRLASRDGGQWVVTKFVKEHTMLRLASRDGGQWVVTKFVKEHTMLRLASRDGGQWVKEHNHSLMSPGKVPWRGSAKNLITEDEKDQRIRELTLELNSEKQKCKRRCAAFFFSDKHCRCAAYQEQLRTILKYVEGHTGQLSKRVQDIVKNIREIEE